VVATLAVLLVFVAFIALAGGYGFVFLVFIAALGGLGWLLAKHRNRLVAAGGQVIASIAGAALVYVPAAAFAVLLFEDRTQDYDAPTLGFQLWFWACYGVPVLVTVAFLAAAARHVERPVLISLVGGGILLALAALPVLLLLSVAAVCGQGIEYLGSGSCPFR
jgi:hypothetical protein